MDREPPSASLIVGRQAYAAILEQMAASARMELVILSHAFDAAVYGAEPLVERVKAFCLAHERARVRVLVNQPALAMRSAHRFVELGRRMPSRIGFRQLDDEDRGVIEELAIGDGRSLLHRETPDQLEARYLADAPLEARLHLKTFDERWERGVPAREFSELKI
ncbi:MAG: hypothetical protein ACPGJF_04570 [Sinimarinibacterium flocculans]|uniref:DUF7931 domain-containing protein n=1 Tax=Sinimarinibacterium flocculans TaxID=985250 RepID=UPI003C65E5A9